MASIPPPPRAIGPYLLEELLGRGGMAEVYRARREGPGGFEKVFALKRILPSYARNPTLIQRFETEARIAGGLDHGNIVHVVDFGEADGEHYIVMEWVDGVPLSTLLRTVAERGRHLPIEVVAHVLSEAAQGLHYAHTRADPAGRPLSIVHRDVSPQNILLARQGDVKISDFGIAKAADSVVRTEAGIQVGKLCYMSPEQAKGDPLDARADVYALGIVLWECLAMRPLFPREDGGEALRSVLEPKHVPPSELCATAPPALDAVVLKALAPARDDRYPDAGALARDLRVYLHSIAPGFGHDELARYLQETLPFAGGAPRIAPAAPVAAAPPAPAASPFPPAVSTPALAASPSALAAPTPVPATSPSAASPSAPAGPPAWPKPGPGHIPPTGPQAEVPPPVAAAPRTQLIFVALGAVVAIMVVGFVAGFIVMRGSRAPKPPPMQYAPGQPAPAAPQRDPGPPAPTSLIPATTETPKVTLHLATNPPGATIVMEGEVAGVTPMDVQVQSQRPLRLGLLLRGHEPLLFPGPPEDFPQLLAGGLQPAMTLHPTNEVLGLVEVKSPSVGSSHVFVDGIDAGEEPVLVQVRFAAGVPATRVEIDVPGQGRQPVDLRPIAVPWELRVVQ